MKTEKRLNWKAIFILLLSITFVACDNSDDDPEPKKNGKDIVELALADETFDSLVVALTEANLVATFQGDNSGPFTVFAPTNGAFRALLSDLNLTKIADIDASLLLTVLQNHVVEGKVKSSSLSDGMLVKTLNGYTFTVNKKATISLDVNSSNKTGIDIIDSDIDATNGVIHVIDEVLVPDTPSPTPTLDIVEIALADDTFDSLVVALTEANLVATFRGDGPYTVFAPTNTAFQNLLTNLSLSRIADIDDATLLAVLQAHAVDGILQSGQLTEGKKVSTLGGEELTFSITSGASVSSDGTTSATISPADQWATNGIIHVIDKVLLP